MTPRNFLIRGLLAGFIAGIVAFGVAYAVGEPAINSAIALEESAAPTPADHEHAEGTAPHSHGGDDEGGISRVQQAGPGLATATIAIGTAFGGLVAILSAFAVGRLGSLRPRASTAVVAATGFLSFALVPWIKYPPNPPAVGDSTTLDERTAQYFAFVAISVISAVVAVIVARRLAATTSGFSAVVAGGAAYLVLIAIVAVTFPAINEVPDSFPANTLYSFRLGSIATQAAMWGTLGLVLSALVGSLYAREQDRQSRRDMIGTARA